MLDPMMELHNGTKRPVMFVVSTPFGGVPAETVIEPGEALVVFDQRVKATAMVRDLTPEEMDAYLEEKLEKAREAEAEVEVEVEVEEKKDGKRKVKAIR